MSVCAVMLVRDEADIIETTVRHLLDQVDEVIVTDHRSVDGTRELLADLPVRLHVAEGKGIWQAKRTNEMAQLALELGHQWVIPCDADELWHAGDRTIRDYLGDLDLYDTYVVKVGMYDHVATAHDDLSEPNPVKRITYRQRDLHGSYKVACRLRDDLVISQGNHNAAYLHAADTVFGMSIRHYSLRSAEHAIRKVRNGRDSYSEEAGMPKDHDVGWKEWGDTDIEIAAQFRDQYLAVAPHNDPNLVHDPAMPSDTIISPALA